MTLVKIYVNVNTRILYRALFYARIRIDVLLLWNVSSIFLMMSPRRMGKGIICAVCISGRVRDAWIERIRSLSLGDTAIRFEIRVHTRTRTWLKANVREGKESESMCGWIDITCGIADAIQCTTQPIQMSRTLGAQSISSIIIFISFRSRRRQSTELYSIYVFFQNGKCDAFPMVCQSARLATADRNPIDEWISMRMTKFRRSFRWRDNSSPWPQPRFTRFNPPIVSAYSFERFLWRLRRIRSSNSLAFNSFKFIYL